MSASQITLCHIILTVNHRGLVLLRELHSRGDLGGSWACTFTIMCEITLSESALQVTLRSACMCVCGRERDGQRQKDLRKALKRNAFKRKVCVHAHVHLSVCLCMCAMVCVCKREKRQHYEWMKLLSKVEANIPSWAPQGHGRASINRSWNKYKHGMASR